MSVSKQEIKRAIDTDIRDITNKISQQTDKEPYQTAFEIILEVLSGSQYKAQQKFNALQLLADVSTKPNMINIIVNSKELLQLMEQFAIIDKHLPLNQRGSTIIDSRDDPQIQKLFYLLNLECISYWAQRFQSDAKGNPTKLLRALQELMKQGVQAIQKFKFFPELDPKFIIPQDKSPQPQQSQQSQIEDPQEIKKIYGEIYNQATQNIFEVENEIKDTTEPDEIIQQIVGSYNTQSKELLKQVEDLMTKGIRSPGSLGEGQQKQLVKIKQFLSTLTSAFADMQNEGFSTDAFLQFKYLVLKETCQFTGTPAPKPPANQQPPKQQEPPKPQEPKYQEPQRQQYTPPLQTPQEPVKQYLDPAKSYNNQIKDPMRSETNYPDKRQQQYEPQSNYPDKRQQQYEPARNDNKASRYEAPKQQPMKPITTMAQSKYQPQEPVKKQPPVQQYQQPPIFKKPVQQTTYSPPKKKQGTHEEFDVQFDALSRSSRQSVLEFPLHDQPISIGNNYQGQFIPYDERCFDVFYQLGLSDNALRRIKIANLKNKATLFETHQIQIGFISDLIYHDITSRYFVRMKLYIGNKSIEAMHRCQIIYEGDTSMGIWVKEPTVLKSASTQLDKDGLHYLIMNQQLEQQISFNYNRIPYEIITGKLIFQDDQNKQTCNFILPCLLTKFINLKDTNMELFNSKWQLKDKYILKSETVPINPKIIKKPSDFRKYFADLVDLTDYQEYMDWDQQQSGNYVFHEMGLLFTLNSPNIEFMLKIIVQPNMAVFFQIIPYNSYQTQAEHILHALVFIFGLPN